MKIVLIWIAACVVLGVGGGLWYLNRPSVVAARVEKTLATATPNAAAKLVRRSFSNGGHSFSLLFPADGLVDKGPLAAKSNQSAVLARPGHTATSYVVFAGPIDNAHDSLRSDCGERSPSSVEFTVNLDGNQVSVCHGSSTPYAAYTMDVRSTGTWEQIILFDNGLVSLTPNDATLKSIFGSLVID